MTESSELSTPTAESSEAEWYPKFVADLDGLRPAKFAELAERYSEWHAAEPFSGPVPVSDGWIEITPQLAEELLRRNLPGANRKAVFSVIQYYAGMMKEGEWPRTGEPIIFSVNGKLLDGQHRLWASLLSGASFPTYVVTNVPEHPQIFAYIDNCKPRNPASALQTAGYNGVSPLISAVLKIAVEIGGYTPSHATRAAKLAPYEYVRLAEHHPNATRAARLASSDWKGAATVLSGHRDVVAYLGMAIMDTFGQEVADDFFGELADLVNDYPSDGPIMKLRKLMATDEKKDRPMMRHQVLGNAIKAFNAWRLGTELSTRWAMLVSEDYPRLVEPMAEAAE